MTGNPESSLLIRTNKQCCHDLENDLLSIGLEEPPVERDGADFPEGKVGFGGVDW